MPVTVTKTIKSIARKSLYSLLMNRLVSRLLPFQNPPLLILSYPRSGSSWVGKVLSTSPSVAYLREPITQPYMFKYGGEYALIDPDQDPQRARIYRKLSNKAFLGIPDWHVNVINNMDDFGYLNRRKKRIMIKEVNPRATKFYCQHYNPKVILLIRHPAALALSFYQLGWLNSTDVQMETGNSNASIWEKFGYAYGCIMQNAVKELTNYGNFELVIYRHLAEDPRNGFRKLFHTLDLCLPENYDEVINKYCYSSKEIQLRGEIERTSQNMIFKWHEELTSQQIADLQRGYFRSPFPYFKQETDWHGSDTAHHS